MPTKVLIIGKVWPEPGSSAAGTRMMQLLDFFKQQGCEIHFVSASGTSEFTANLSALGIHTASILLNDSSFDVFISELDPQLVMFDRFTTEEQFGWRVAKHCPKALRLLDTEDLHCLRYARQMALNAQRDFNDADLVNDHSKREIASIYRCDLSLIISEYEMQLLSSFFKIDSSLLFYLPFLFEPLSEDRFSKLPSFSERKHFVSLGNFLHEPNWDAVRYLKKHIWPRIRERLPKAELHVYGAYPSQKVFELDHKQEGFLIKGRANDAAKVMQNARVCLAPLRFGAGLKGKLADAMLNGTPSVTTAIGAEGMQGSLPWPGIVAEDPQELAEAAVVLYEQEDQWKSAQLKALNILNQRFQKSNFVKPLEERISFLQNNLELYRRLNFTGAMLMHHTISGSRYMALWIEEKNRRQIN